VSGDAALSGSGNCDGANGCGDAAWSGSGAGENGSGDAETWSGAVSETFLEQRYVDVYCSHSDSGLSSPERERSAGWCCSRLAGGCCSLLVG